MGSAGDGVIFLVLEIAPRAAELNTQQADFQLYKKLKVSM